MRRPLVAGNWKMNGTRQLAHGLAGDIAASIFADVDVLLCPPAAYLSTVAEVIAGTTVALGAQDCSEFEAGAYTGEHAVSMLHDLGATYTLVGHSERRTYFGDSDSRVAAKVGAACTGGLTPILCVGETLQERRADATTKVVTRQLDSVLNLPQARDIAANLVLAYEPVWAIGTGESASPAQAQEVHALIRQRLMQLDKDLAGKIRILYGGSVKPDNALELFSMPDIDGGLIGGASLQADSFISICKAALSAS
jgi:triosephosphate isomerase